MLKNYFKIAVRNLVRYKGFSFINIVGLAIGMACSILIFLWVHDELSYDKFHTNADDISRVVVDTNRGRIWSTTPIPMGLVLNNDYPEVVNSTRVKNSAGIFSRNEKIFGESGCYVDKSFLEMFSFLLIMGNIENALSDLHSIVITEKLADKYFPDEDPIGKSIKVNNSEFTVTGVINNVSQNSHLQFNYLMPFTIFEQSDHSPEHWGRFQVLTYVQLHKEISFNEFENKITNLMAEHIPDSKATLHLQPMLRIHLYALNGTGPIVYVYIFSIIAGLILMIACINFMNLYTAKSSKRTKEIGMRKVNGAQRSDLLKQFFGESILLSFIALIIALILVELFLPAFNNLTGKNIVLNFISNWNILIMLIILGLITGIISGCYPAVFLSSLKTFNILKGKLIPGKPTQKSSLFRKSLVVFQFAISVFLLISTIVISNQLKFIQNTELGFNKNNVIYFPMSGDIESNFLSMKTELLKDTRISDVSLVSEPPVEIWKRKTGFDWEGLDKDSNPEMAVISVDHDFIKTFNIEVTQGRSFSEEFSTDASSGYILNETAAKMIGDDSLVGKEFSFCAREGWRRGNIVAVIKDFHFSNLHNDIEPLMMWINPSDYNFFCAKINTNDSDMSEVISYLRTVWKRFAPDYPFNYNFIDDYSKNMYSNEQSTNDLIRYFTYLAIIITCLGLFSLSAYMIEQRTKEIGIRKVLGASIGNIFRLISKEFILLVVIANIITWPVAYFATSSWLGDFAYKVRIGLGTYFLSGTIAILIALLTVGYQVLKAANANPVKALKYE
ncbi:MAG: ABC transporter permease [Candidatus Cloacimonetes bacterium]|nr:ABC transporter permease [Candidatus Cloacimonadota bacterium]